MLIANGRLGASMCINHSLVDVASKKLVIKSSSASLILHLLSFRDEHKSAPANIRGQPPTVKGGEVIPA